MTEQLLQLYKQISNLESLRQERESNQIRYPLDPNSIKVVKKGVLIHSDFDVIPAGLASPYDEFIEVKVNNQKYLLKTTKVVKFAS